MKFTIRLLLLAGIVCSAAFSANRAVRLYREKYMPRYLDGYFC